MEAYDSLNLKGYEPRQSALRFAGTKDQWPAFRWQFLAIVDTLGENAIDILEVPMDDAITKRLTQYTKIKTEAKTSSDPDKATRERVDKAMDSAPEDVRKLRKMVCRQLVQSLSGRAITLVQSIAVDDPHAMWSRLKVEFEGKGSSSIMALYQQAAAIRHEAGTPLSGTIAKFDDIFRRMTDKKDNPSNGYRVGQLISCLPKEYGAIVAAMNALDRDWTWQEAIDRLFAHQEANNLQIAHGKTKPSPEVYTASSPIDAKVCGNCGRNGHYASECRSNCRKCPPSATGHASKDCPGLARRGRDKTRGKYRGGKQGKRPSGALLSSGYPPDEESWLLYESAMLTDKKVSFPINIIDSGCTSHMISKSQLCSKVSHCEPINVSTASPNVLRITKRGNASIKIVDGSGTGRTALLHDALISPSLDFNWFLCRNWIALDVK